jgi:hypothetical protein
MLIICRRCLDMFHFHAERVVVCSHTTGVILFCFPSSAHADAGTVLQFMGAAWQAAPLSQHMHAKVWAFSTVLTQTFIST